MLRGGKFDAVPDYGSPFSLLSALSWVLGGFKKKLHGPPRISISHLNPLPSSCRLALQYGYYHDSNQERRRSVNVSGLIEIRKLLITFADARFSKLPDDDSRFPDINTIRAAIPKHCFEPSVAISMGYLVRDAAMIGALGWAAITYIPTIPDSTIRAIAWVAYGFVQGLICTGLWILGHEAGHGAFSQHALLNHVVGFFSHSTLLVPYYSWKFSHHRHHMFTGHMEKDMAFVPRTKPDYVTRTLAAFELLEDTPIYQLTSLLLHQLFAWQIYLVFNISAGRGSLQKPASTILGKSHFAPNSAVFRRSEAPWIALSDIGIGMMLFALYKLAGVVGTSTVLLAYAQPYFWVHHWLSTF